MHDKKQKFIACIPKSILDTSNTGQFGFNNLNFEEIFL